MGKLMCWNSQYPMLMEEYSYTIWVEIPCRLAATLTGLGGISTIRRPLGYLSRGTIRATYVCKQRKTEAMAVLAVGMFLGNYRVAPAARPWRERTRP
jgi:hypothetical protein